MRRSVAQFESPGNSLEFLMCAARIHPLAWVVEELNSDPSYFEKPMFGCRACYHRGRMKAVLADQGEPWSGILVPTEREHHASLIAELPDLEAHPILGKWLYLSQQCEDFESVCERLVALMRRDDARLGIVPGEKKRSRGKKKSARPRKTARRTPRKMARKKR